MDIEHDNKSKVIAVDVATGIVLDQNLDWYVGDPGQQKWERAFADKEKAIAFCNREASIHPDVEYIVLKDGEGAVVIVNEKWKR